MTLRATLYAAATMVLASACQPEFDITSKNDDPPITDSDTSAVDTSGADDDTGIGDTDDWRDTDMLDTGDDPPQVPLLDFHPLVIDFGYVEEGTSVSDVVTVSNLGFAILNVTDIGIMGWPTFTLTDDSDLRIAPGESTTLEVTYTAGDTSDEATLGFLTNDPAGDVGTVLLLGTGEDPAVEVPDYDFGNVIVNTTTRATYPISNPGNAAVTISAINLTDPAFVVDPSSLPVVVGPGGTNTVDLLFTPTALASYTATLSVVSDARVTPGTATITGTGADRPEAVCEAVPSQLLVGESFWFRGEDSTDPQGSPLTYTWRFLSQPSGSNLTMPGGPDANRGPISPVEGGDYQAELVVENDLGFTDVCVATATLVGAPERLLEVTDLEFGYVLVNTPAVEGLTLFNPGTDPTVVSGIAIPGSVFTVNGTFPLTVPAGQTRTVPVTFEPLQMIDYLSDIQVIADVTSPIAPATAHGHGAGNPTASCLATPPYPVLGTDDFTLDGSGSSDPIGRPLSFAWSFTSVPQGSGVTMPNGGAIRGPITPDRLGDYVATLIVTNDLGYFDTCSATASAIQAQDSRLVLTNLDFGDVLVGDLAEQAMPMSNPGSDAVTVTAVNIADPVFRIPGGQLPVTIPAGQTRFVNVQFQPDDYEIYSASITATSDATAPTQPRLATGRGVSYPVANCEADPDILVAIHETFMFRGSASYDPGGRPLSYDWELLSRPLGSTVVMPNGGANRGPITPDSVGDYVGQLTVTNDLGFSDTCTATATAEANADLWIEMFWQHSGDDMDLHLLQRLNSNFRSSDDCYYANCRGSNGLAWGNPGTQDNAFLDRDDIPGTGPENINVGDPIPQWYRVFVHDYPGSRYNPLNNVTVRIYIDGLLEYDETKQITGEDDYVEFAQINWNQNPPVIIPQ